MKASLRSSAVSGMLWTAMERFGHQFLRLIIGIIIARILEPSMFGIVGMTVIFTDLAQSILDSGFGSALIQKKDRNEVDYSTCFYFRFSSVRFNRLRNKLLANYLRNRGNDLATVQISAICGAMLSNNSSWIQI